MKRPHRVDGLQPVAASPRSYRKPARFDLMAAPPKIVETIETFAEISVKQRASYAASLRLVATSEMTSLKHLGGRREHISLSRDF